MNVCMHVRVCVSACVSSNCFLYTFTSCSAFATLRLLFHVVLKHAGRYLPFCVFLHYATRKYFFLFNCFLLAVSQHELSLLSYIAMSQPQRHSFNTHVLAYTHLTSVYRCRENNELFSLR